MSENYPIGVQSFEKLRSEGFVYVDKTSFVHKLTCVPGYYFLSRPRRFGKSLLLSTIEAYYLGKRELFKGLAIDSLTDDWAPHPVFHIDLNNKEYSTYEALPEVLNSYLEQWESVYGDEKRHRAVEERFAYVIRRAYEHTGQKVVILIDEYDKPLLNAVDDAKLSDEYRATLKAFYSNLKTMDQYIEFAMLTGVARFSKVSIFSDLNNLRDISFENKFATICGITDKELDSCFKNGIQALAEANVMSTEATRDALRRKYDGYHFTAASEGIYNPLSLMRVFASGQFGNYWAHTGTPTFLVRLMRNADWNLRDISGYTISAEDLESAGILENDPIPAFYQTGYLTIKSYDSQFNSFVLDYPNEEVKSAFLRFLIPYYLDGIKSGTEFTINQFVADVLRGDVEAFMERLKALVAKVPYAAGHNAPESHFQNAIYLIFTLMGFYTTVEERLSSGRTDIRVETADCIYVFEFKINENARVAMEQIKDRDYAAPYRVCGKHIVLIGANFDSKTRRLDDILVERV